MSPSTIPDADPDQAVEDPAPVEREDAGDDVPVAGDDVDDDVDDRRDELADRPRHPLRDGYDDPADDLHEDRHEPADPAARVVPGVVLALLLLPFSHSSTGLETCSSIHSVISVHT